MRLKLKPKTAFLKETKKALWRGGKLHTDEKLCCFEESLE